MYNQKVAIVTGGASGIGRALCVELAKRGAHVTVADLNEAGAHEAADAICQSGGKADAAALDITSAEGVLATVAAVAEKHGRLDYMFNNAGVGFAGDVRDIGLDAWRRYVDINLMGTLHGTVAAYSLMAKQGSGHIVNTASLAGLLGFPTAAPYSMTKHAIIGLSMSLRFEGADLGIKVSVACPGYVRTQFYNSATVVNADRDKLFGTIPFKMMTADQAAVAILQGVSKNRAIIVFPFSARLLWRLYRYCPALLTPMGRRIVRQFRANRAP